MPSRKSYSSYVSLAGAALLSYVAGAAVIFFGLPSSSFLERAFIGAGAWSRPAGTPPPRQQPSAGRPAASAGLMTDEPSNTFDGFTLYSCLDNEGEGTEALLIDMQGEAVHRWSVPTWQMALI